MAAIFGPAANLAAKVVIVAIAVALMMRNGAWVLWPRTDYARNLQVRRVTARAVQSSASCCGPGAGLPVLSCRASRCPPMRACRLPTPA